MKDWLWEKGYDLYKTGQKLPRNHNQDVANGWWAAHDKGERFGEYETFLQAPD